VPAQHPHPSSSSSRTPTLQLPMRPTHPLRASLAQVSRQTASLAMHPTMARTQGVYLGRMVAIPLSSSSRAGARPLLLLQQLVL
jgi:hypothetical protein